MELYEFDVADHGAGAVSRGNTIAGRHVGIRGFLENTAKPAGGQQHRSRQDPDLPALLTIARDSAE